MSSHDDAIPLAANILVTGAAGFIGSHTVLELLEAGCYNVTAIDNFANAVSVDGRPASLERVSQIVGKPVNFKECDLLDRAKLEQLFDEYHFDAVIHLASIKSIAPSIRNPLKYYKANLVGSLNLFECCHVHGVKTIVFSSSSTVYGEPKGPLMQEGDETAPNNPYGRTKKIIEQILGDLCKADPEWRVIILRYFSPVGAHPSGLIGESPREDSPYLVPSIARVVRGEVPFLRVNASFDTPDGTGLRDYIHIMDVAKANLTALRRVMKDKAENESGGVELYNIGSGRGYSVKEMIAAFEKACGSKVNVQISDERRPGDIGTLCGDVRLASEKLGWKAQYGIDEMCRDAWNWMVKNPDGYSATSSL